MSRRLLRKLRMKKSILATAVFVVFTLSGCAEMRRDKNSIAVDVVNQAAETVQRFKGMPDLKVFADHMPTARGIVVLPSVIKGGLDTEETIADNIPFVPFIDLKPL